jgi:hypothetical protein
LDGGPRKLASARLSGAQTCCRIESCRSRSAPRRWRS